MAPADDPPRQGAMNWLSNFVRPKLQALVRKTEVPENLWHKCQVCGQMIFHRELEANLRVCTHCGHHMRIGVQRRLALLFDDGDFQRIELPRSEPDPLKFRDRKRYSDRLRESQARTGEPDAVIVAHGKLGGIGVVIAAFNFDFMAGSMGTAVGEGLIAAARLAVLEAICRPEGEKNRASIFSSCPLRTVADAIFSPPFVPMLLLLCGSLVGSYWTEKHAYQHPASRPMVKVLISPSMSRCCLILRLPIFDSCSFVPNANPLCG